MDEELSGAGSSDAGHGGEASDPRAARQRELAILGIVVMIVGPLAGFVVWLGTGSDYLTWVFQGAGENGTAAPSQEPATGTAALVACVIMAAGTGLYLWGTREQGRADVARDDVAPDPEDSGPGRAD